MVFSDLAEIAQISLLFDFYGGLLKDRQKEIMSLYHEENLTIVEIANELNITKQGVHESLKKSEKLLYSYEEELGLIDKFLLTKEKLEDILKIVNQLDITEDNKNEIRRIIDTIED